MRRTFTPLLLAALAWAGPAAAQTNTTGQTAQSAPAPRASTASYIALGNSYYASGQFDGAYVAFRAAAESDPTNTDALYGLGRSQIKLRLYAPAIETLRRLIQVDPRNVSGHVALAQAYVTQHINATNRASVAPNLDEALKVLAAAETVRPDSPAVWNERANVYRLKGDYKTATEMMRRAAQYAPDNSVILYNLGDLYYITGDLPAAVATLQKAVIADPSDAVARAYYGRLLMISGKADAARLELAQAERLAPTNAYIVGQYGVFGYLAKDAKLARDKLGLAIKLDPLRYPEFYYYLGRLQFDSGRPDAARSDLTKAVALNSVSSEYRYWLGRAQEAAGDRDAAVAAYNDALRLDPNHKASKEALARLK